MIRLRDELIYAHKNIKDDHENPKKSRWRTVTVRSVYWPGLFTKVKYLFKYKKAFPLNMLVWKLDWRCHLILSEEENTINERKSQTQTRGYEAQVET